MSETLLPPNVTAEEIAQEHATSRIGEVPVDINLLWNPDACPLVFLPWLAWAMSVDEWDANWPDHQKREVIKASVRIHRRKGTAGAVKDSLAVLGGHIEVVEWFENQPKTTPHTFRLVVNYGVDSSKSASRILDMNFYRSVRRLVDNAKPVRSHYEIFVSLGFHDSLGIGNVLSAGQYLRKDAEAKQEQIKTKSGLNAASITQVSTALLRKVTFNPRVDFNNIDLAVVSICRPISFAQFSMEAS